MYHILIVDEEEHLLWALERNLFPERTDVVVHTAGSGEEGLEVLQDESIDLLISDIKMPGQVDGFQLILRAKEMVPDARVMIITAFGTHRIQNFAERIGISHYIEKPFTVDELRNAVLEILDEKEGFQGVLSDLELTDIIQMLCLAKRTALLHLKHRDHRGRIVFDAGDVVHAEFDGDVGPEAVYIMLDLRQGDIFMQSDFDPVDRTIEMGWQDLLLEGVKRTDEQRLQAHTEEVQEKQEKREAKEAAKKADVEKAESEVGSGLNRDSSGRTRTPMGVGAAALDSEVSEMSEASEISDVFEDGEADLDEVSGAMLFSEAELEEITRASEAAIDEDPDPGDDDSSQLSDSAVQESEELEQGQEYIEDSVFEDSSAADSEVADSEVIDDESSQYEDFAVEEAETSEMAVVTEQAAVIDDQGAKPTAPPMGTDGISVDTAAAIASEQEQAPTADEGRVRRRSGTSPGMAAVSPPGGPTEESGEYELFAAPALSGRRTGEDSGVHELFTDHQNDDRISDETTNAIEEFINECPGLKATAVISVDDGKPLRAVNLSYEDGFDGAILASRLADVFARANRSVEAFDGDDALEEFQLVLEHDYLLMRMIENKSLIHVAIVDRRVSLGIALVLMRQFGKQLTSIESL